MLLDLPQVSRDVLSQLTGFGSLSLFLHPLCLSNCTAHRCRHNNSSYSRFLHRIIAMSLYTVLVPYDIEQNVARGIVRKFLTLPLSTLNHCTVVIHCRYTLCIHISIWLAVRDLYRLTKWALHFSQRHSNMNIHHSVANEEFSICKQLYSQSEPQCS